MRECVTIAASAFMLGTAGCSVHLYEFIPQTKSMSLSLTMIPILQMMKLRPKWIYSDEAEIRMQV